MTLVKTWDAFVRSFHWLLVLLVLAAFLSAEAERVTLHVRLGLCVLGLLVARAVWGFIGPPVARFRSFVRPPGAVLAYLRACLGGRPPVHASHNPLGGSMVMAFFAVLAAMGLTGVLATTGPESGGTLQGLLSAQAAHGAKEVHEGLFVLLATLVGLHVAGVLVSSVLERQNLVKGMISGLKRPPDPPGSSLEDASPGATPPAAAGGRGRAALAVGLGAAAAVVLGGVVGAPTGDGGEHGGRHGEDRAGEHRSERGGQGDREDRGEREHRGSASTEPARPPSSAGRRAAPAAGGSRSRVPLAHQAAGGPARPRAPPTGSTPLVRRSPADSALPPAPCSPSSPAQVRWCFSRSRMA